MSKINCEICGRRLNIRWSFSSCIWGEHVYCSFTCQAIGQRYTFLLFFIVICALYLVLFGPLYLDLFYLFEQIQRSVLLFGMIGAILGWTIAVFIPAYMAFVTIWGFYNKPRYTKRYSR
ncbi:MAG: hypothetical protein ACFFCZ_17570 [Promethearchaeota archaeon]